MPATQQDREMREWSDERWQLTLDAIGENTRKYDNLLRAVQNGFNSIGSELNTLYRRQARLERMFFWLLGLVALNMVGWIAVAALLSYGLMRLFSVT